MKVEHINKHMKIEELNIFLLLTNKTIPNR